MPGCTGHMYAKPGKKKPIITLDCLLAGRPAAAKSPWKTGGHCPQRQSFTPGLCRFQLPNVWTNASNIEFNLTAFTASGGEPLQYSWGLGTQAGLTDVIPLTPVTSAPQVGGPALRAGRLKPGPVQCAQCSARTLLQGVIATGMGCVWGGRGWSLAGLGA